MKLESFFSFKIDFKHLNLYFFADSTCSKAVFSLLMCLKMAFHATLSSNRNVIVNCAKAKTTLATLVT